MSPRTTLLKKLPTPKEHAAKCRLCKSWFTYSARLPNQDVCVRCYYESRSDLTGALQEAEWIAAFQAGFAKAEDIYYPLIEARAKADEPHAT